MIPLTRVRERGVPAGLTGKARIKKNLSVFAAIREGAAPTFSTAHWKPAKDNLRKESLGKCAYCESLAATVAHCDVEHFRPKSIYWWLAYCYDNYLFSCQLCNQSYKSDEFPVSKRMTAPTVTPRTPDAMLERLAAVSSPDPKSESDGMAWAEFAALCKRELAQLPNPYVQDPTELFAWKADEVEKYVLLVPSVDSQASRNAVKACETFLGLNREELKRARYQAYRSLAVLREVIEVAGRESRVGRVAGKGIDEACEDGQPYAGMARYFRSQWKLARNA